MPKMKTKKSMTRRVKVTATGKVMAFKSGKRHQNTGKSGDERKAFMKTCLSASKSDAQQGKAKS